MMRCFLHFSKLHSSECVVELATNLRAGLTIALRAPYDLCVIVLISHLLTMFRHLFSIVSFKHLEM